MITKPDSALTRRTVLRGLGVSMALPWLESLPSAAAASSAAQPPTRTLVTFTGMGFHSQHWWAKGEGAKMELGPCLKPLEPWRERLVFLRGLWNEQANNGVIHCMQTGNMLSGAPMSKTEVRTGISFDQLMAQRIGDRTRIPSLVLGCEGPIPGLQDGHPLLYSSHISWSTAVSPTWTETRPALAFDQLFRTDRNKGDRRVVDAVLEDAKSLRQRLSVSDQQRFEEYLGSVHEIEGRIKRAGKERDAGAWKPTLAAPDRPRPSALRKRRCGRTRSHSKGRIVTHSRANCARTAAREFTSVASASARTPRSGREGRSVARTANRRQGPMSDDCGSPNT